MILGNKGMGNSLDIALIRRKKIRKLLSMLVEI